MSGGASNDLLGQLIRPEDLSPLLLVTVVRRLAGEYDNLAEAINNRLPPRLLRDPGRFDIRPLLDIIDEFSDRSCLRKIAIGMWRDISSTASAARLLLEKR